MDLRQPGVRRFIDLADVPNTYAGSATKVATVNAGATGLEFDAPGAGGGFTALVATETPNGSLTVFTFATAGAQPSFIISDGIWMEATDQGSVVNWTWNAGAKTATLTIPPVSGVKGIV